MTPVPDAFRPAADGPTIEGVDAALLDGTTEAEVEPMGTAIEVFESAVAQTVVLPALPAGLLSMKERRHVILAAKGHALPASDYALWAFVIVTAIAWAPYLSGSRPDLDGTLQWQLAAIPISLGLRWFVNLINGFAAQNALEVLRVDAQARAELTTEQREEYYRRETAFAMR